MKMRYGITRDIPMRTLGVRTIVMVLSIACMGSAYAQTGTITAVSPQSAEQGTSGLLVSFTLGSTPPPPPTDAPLKQANLGAIAGTSLTRAGQYEVTAIFSIPASESVGSKDVSVTFPGPNGDVLFSISGGFTVTAQPDGPPAVTQQPRSRSVVSGGTVTFTVIAAGSTPLDHQWQKDGGDLTGGTQSSYTIPSVSQDDEGNYSCIVTNAHGSTVSNEAVLAVVEGSANSYPIVDTNQTTFYNNSTAIAAPSEGAAFSGQDAYYENNSPSYTLSEDDLTVLDNVTGLRWQRSPDHSRDGTIDSTDKLSWPDALDYPATLNSENFGGYSDWRLPTIKELYSLILFSGDDPSGVEGDDTSGLTPFIDTDVFDFAYGDTAADERIIDAQYWSSNAYVWTTMNGDHTVFGVNFADGRIKGYGTSLHGTDKTAFVIYVRGAPEYGINSFADNGDGTVTDEATGLMWMQNDSGLGYNWQDALAHAEETNFAGHDDWRLPNVKELQSLVDYTRSPSTSGSAAIDPLFNATSIVNEAGDTDYSCYWSGTTHATSNGMGAAGAYVAFGRAMGYMSDTWLDVHGAGAQRSDPKSGDPAEYPTGHGPQGDAIRIYNHVRLVRNAETAPTTDVSTWVRY